MGKLTYKGFVPKDDPMFSTGPEAFSRLASTPSSETSPSATTGATRAKSDSAPVETEQDGLRAQELRIAKLYRNNPKARDEALAKIRAARKD